MQAMITNFEDLKSPPFQNNFISYLKAQGVSEAEIEKIIISLDSFLETMKNTPPVFYAISYAKDTIHFINRYSKREERKELCYYLYKRMEKTKMKRSEKVKAIANELEVKKDCVQVYLRELFPEK